MVSNVHQDERNYNNSSAYNNEYPRTLCDWVRQFRLKKIQMKRKLKLGGDLRVCALLTTSLMRTELELKRKQQERFQRWLEFQAKINNQPKQSSGIYNYNKHNVNEERIYDEVRPIQGFNIDKSEEVEKLWKCELSDLDNFLRSISSTTVTNKKSESSSCRCSPFLINSNCYHVAAAENSRDHHASTLQNSREQSVVS